MSETTNLKLFKHDNPPTNENQFDVEKSLNQNWEKVDTAYGNLNSNKVDKVEGKDLSTEDFTTELKSKLEDLENYNDTEIKSDIEDIEENISTLQTNVANKVDKEEGKGLSTNDFSDEYKEKLDGLKNYDDTEIKADITELEGKVSTLEEDNTQNKSDISELQQSQEDQDEYLKDIYNALPTETAEGENINIKGTANIKFKEFVVGGNSKQEIREGYNLLKYNDDLVNQYVINGITFTINDDGSITANGTATANATLNFVGGPGNYTINLEAGDYTLSGCEGGSSSTYYMEIYDGSSYRACQNGKITFNITSTSIRVYISVKNGVTVNNVKFYPMLAVGTEEKEYEPYGASPSPDFKSDIQNVEGNANIAKCNKNIMPINTSNYFEFTDRGIKRNSNNYDGATVATFKIKKGKKIKIGLLLFSKPSTSTSFSFYVDGASNSSCVFGNINNNTLNQIYKKDYTATEDVELSYRLWGNSNNEEFEFQLWAEYDELTNYEKHEEQVITFPLSEGQKLYLGDYLASDGIHHKGTQIELDEEDTSWRLGQYAAEGTTQFTMDKPSNISSLRFCSHFVNKEQTLNGMYLGSALSFYPATNTGLTSLELWKSYLTQQKTAGTPVILEYDLAEEEIEAYTEAQQEAYNQLLKLKSYDGSTNIYSINETSPIFKVTAIKSLNNVNEQLKNLNNMIAQINTVLLERS